MTINRTVDDKDRKRQDPNEDFMRYEMKTLGSFELLPDDGEEELEGHRT